MVDYLSLALSHAVLLLAFWRLVWRDDLDRDPSDEQQSGQADKVSPNSARGGPVRRA